MYLLVLKTTGHVLAAYTEVPQGGDPTIENLCGLDFAVASVRSAGGAAAPLEVAVAREQIEVRSAPVDPAVLANPRGFMADGSSTTAILTAPAVQTPTLDKSKPGQIEVPDFTSTQGLVALNRSDDPANERRLGLPPAEAPFDEVTLKTSPAAGVIAPISGAAGTKYNVLVAVPGRPLALLMVVSA